MRPLFLDLAAHLAGASGGVLVVGLTLGGAVGKALEYGAALCAIAGAVCLALGRVAGRGKKVLLQQ